MLVHSEKRARHDPVGKSIDQPEGGASGNVDLAKSVFQVHAVDAEGHVVVRKALRRAQVLPFFAELASCLVGMEACGTSHYWARELIRLGHEVRLMPPGLRQALCEAGQDGCG